MSAAACIVRASAGYQAKRGIRLRVVGSDLGETTSFQSCVITLIRTEHPTASVFLHYQCTEITRKSAMLLSGIVNSQQLIICYALMTRKGGGRDDGEVKSDEDEVMGR